MKRRLARLASWAGALWRKVKPEVPFDFLPRPEWEARNLMMMLTVIAAAVTLALTMEPGGPPGGYRFDPIDQLSRHKARPLHELPSGVQRSVKAALVRKDCAAATDALIDVYIEDYPSMRRLRREEDYRYWWWAFAGRDVYRDGFVCFTAVRLREFADEYVEAGGGDYRWCGDDLTDEPDYWSERAAYEIDSALGWLSTRAQEGHPEAVRALLSAHDAYEFIELEDISRYALLARLAERTELTGSEQSLREELAARLPEDARFYAEHSFDWTTSMRRFGSCGNADE